MYLHFFLHYITQEYGRTKLVREQPLLILNGGARQSTAAGEGSILMTITIIVTAAQCRKKGKKVKLHVVSSNVKSWQIKP